MNNQHLYFLHTKNRIKKNGDKIGSFLPSLQRMLTERFVTKCDITALLDRRWVVILGDPGCSKTTLLRWITGVYAEAVLRGDDKSFFRIPILIRISEFTEWLTEMCTGQNVLF